MCVCAECPQVKTEGGKIIRVEAHPIPEHPRPKRCQVAHRSTCKGQLCLHVPSRQFIMFLVNPWLPRAHNRMHMRLEEAVHAVQGRVALVGDAAGYVTKCSGEGIYFAAKSGRMAAEAIVEASQNGARCACHLLHPGFFACPRLFATPWGLWDAA